MEKDIILFEPQHDPALLIDAGEYAYEQGKAAAATEAKLEQQEGTSSDPAAETGSRIAQEKWRKQNETARISAEEARKVAEGSDDSTSQYYESGRCFNERKRQNAETARSTAETGRNTAETARNAAEAKREAFEKGGTYTDETGTHTITYANSRQGMEASRAAAEAQRETTVTTEVGKVETALTNIERVRKNMGAAFSTYQDEAEKMMSKAKAVENIGSYTAKQAEWCEAKTNEAIVATNEAEKINATLSGSTLIVTDRNGVSMSVETKGAKGDPGSDAEVTKSNIETALGYTPADKSKLGDTTTLNTTDKTSAVKAINEVNTNLVQLGASAGSMITQLQYDLGDKSQLTTDAKNNLVAAINEVDGKTDEFQTELSAIDDKIISKATQSTGSVNLTNEDGSKSISLPVATTTKAGIVLPTTMLSVNKLKTDTHNLSSALGTLSDLSTTDKKTIVAAVNEVNSKIPKVSGKADKTALADLRKDMNDRMPEGTICTYTTSTEGDRYKKIPVHLSPNRTYRFLFSNVTNIGCDCQINKGDIGGTSALWFTTDLHSGTSFTYETGETEEWDCLNIMCESDGAILTISGHSTIDKFNEIENNLGTLSSLTTTDKSSAVAAINEVDAELGEISTEITDLQRNVVKLVSTTYAALKAKRDAGQLVAGMQYRITDYACTTTQENTQSAGHVFDIIVTADSENTLNENARAIQHDGDTYFADCDLSAWELKYCIDNDTDRFLWADEENGKGVIFYMKDEWNNECPYDFKNIMFLRIIARDENEWGWVVNEEEGEETYLHTFSAYDYDNDEWKDASMCNGLAPDDGCCSCQNNNIRPYSFNYDRGENSCCIRLNNIVFMNVYSEDDCSYFECYSNTFGNGCCDNTFGNSCFSNTFDSDCFSNTFGNSCHYNTFGDSCHYNTFGDYCSYNTFGDSCNSNTFDSSCYSNTFGSGCYSNTFGSGCYSNTFDSYCSSNTFGSSCYSNTFGNACYSNTFGNECSSNTFGSYCSSNTFGNYCSSNTFGNECSYNTFGEQVKNNKKLKSYIRYVTIENGVQYVNITTSATTSGSNYAQNIHINGGFSGTSSNRKTCSISSTNNAFLTTFGSESDTTINV